jgi:hypothetical protein
MDSLHRILQHSGEVASAGVSVDAKDAEAVSFYKKYGLLELPDVERRLFLPMGTVAELFRWPTPHSFSRSRMAPFPGLQLRGDIYVERR